MRKIYITLSLMLSLCGQQTLASYVQKIEKRYQNCARLLRCKIPNSQQLVGFYVTREGGGHLIDEFSFSHSERICKALGGTLHRRSLLKPNAKDTLVVYLSGEEMAVKRYVKMTKKEMPQIKKSPIRKRLISWIGKKIKKRLEKKIFLTITNTGSFIDVRVPGKTQAQQICYNGKRFVKLQDAQAEKAKIANGESALSDAALDVNPLIRERAENTPTPQEVKTIPAVQQEGMDPELKGINVSDLVQAGEPSGRNLNSPNASNSRTPPTLQQLADLADAIVAG